MLTAPCALTTLGAATVAAAATAAPPKNVRRELLPSGDALALLIRYSSRTGGLMPASDRYRRLIKADTATGKPAIIARVVRNVAGRSGPPETREPRAGRHRPLLSLRLSHSRSVPHGTFGCEHQGAVNGWPSGGR